MRGSLHTYLFYLPSAAGSLYYMYVAKDIPDQNITQNALPRAHFGKHTRVLIYLPGMAKGARPLRGRRLRLIHVVALPIRAPPRPPPPSK